MSASVEQRPRDSVERPREAAQRDDAAPDAWPEAGADGVSGAGLPGDGADGDDAARDDAARDDAAWDGTARDDVAQDAVLGPSRMRVDFGAHLETHYPRLVAQLYAITLDPREAHEVVQDAYSRAWKQWAEVGGSPDATAWVRRVAVRSTIRSWRRALARFGIGRAAPPASADARTGAMLAALGRLEPPERRAVVMFHMAGASLEEIAAIEGASHGTVQARLARARNVVTDGMADVLGEVLGPPTGGDEHYLGRYGEEWPADPYTGDVGVAKGW